VPLNFTFRHLHQIILWLFDEGGEGKVSDEYVFEVKKDAELSLARIGEFEQATTTAKLSSIRDPLYTDEDEEEGDWVWEAEEAFTLKNVWPLGGDLKRGILYVRVFYSSQATFAYGTCRTTTRRLKYILPSTLCLSRRAKEGTCPIFFIIITSMSSSWNLPCGKKGILADLNPSVSSHSTSAQPRRSTYELHSNSQSPRKPTQLEFSY
jgi:hypothetical protein